MDNEAIPNEAAKYSPITETLQVPLTEGEFVHFTTSEARLTDAFAELSGKLGYDPAQAISFFQDNVEFTFGRLKNPVMTPPQVTKFDKAVEEVLSFIQRASYLGAVSHSKKGGFEFALNIPVIAKYLPQMTRKKFGIKDYPSQTTDEKIGSIKQVVESITIHELYHLIQFMTQPEFMSRAVDKALWTQRLLVAYTTSVLATSYLAPQHALDVAELGSLALLGGILYLRKDGSLGKKEADAYEVQKKALGMELVNKPFILTHEHTQVTRNVFGDQL